MEKSWKQLACEYEVILETAVQVLKGILPDVEYAWGDEDKIQEYIEKGKRVIELFEKRK